MTRNLTLLPLHVMERVGVRCPLAAGVVVCLVLAGCAKEGDNLPIPPPPGPTALTAALSASADGISQMAFPGNADEIVLATSWQNLSGPHTQLTRWRLPNGQLYEQVTQGVSGSPPTVVTHLAVSGTPIADRRLYGTWRVEVFLDTTPTPAASRVFRIGDTP